MEIKLTAVIRGRYGQQLTPMLQDIQSWGAEIEYVDKLTYQKRDDPEYLRYLREYYPGAAIIPEGGSQHQAMEGIADIHNELFQHYDYILSPVASGGTLAGLIHGNHCLQTKITGIAVLKGEDYLESLVNRLLPEGSNDRWSINHEFHGGGYAKSPEELTDFCKTFSKSSGFDIEPVYSGKVFYAARQLVERGAFEKR